MYANRRRGVQAASDAREWERLIAESKELWKAEIAAKVKGRVERKGKGPKGRK